MLCHQHLHSSQTSYSYAEWWWKMLLLVDSVGSDTVGPRQRWLLIQLLSSCEAPITEMGRQRLEEKHNCTCDQRRSVMSLRNET